jgi:deoxyribonuclease (pyrimidine dimer)
MTRINCISPKELHKKHLVAEYHEITRVFSLVRKLIDSGKDPFKCGAPEHYVLGTGHVRFFYTKLAWIQNRIADLALEMDERGIRARVELIKGISNGIPEECFGQWEPTEADMALNRERLNERLAQMADKPKRKVPTLDD